MGKLRDLSEYTTKELYQLHYALQWELMRRQWWIIPLALLVGVWAGTR